MKVSDKKRHVEIKSVSRTKKLAGSLFEHAETKPFPSRVEIHETLKKAILSGVKNDKLP